MKVKIKHSTIYTLTPSALLDPHIFRLKPRHINFQQLLDFKIKIDPKPAGINEELDAEGNIVLVAWFKEKISTLTIKTESIVKTKKRNLFNFVVYPFDAYNLPIQYREEDKESLAPYLKNKFNDPELKKFADKIEKESNGILLNFVVNMIIALNKLFETEIRDEGEPYKPIDCWNAKKGSCRDLTYLAMTLFRMKGIAARFVSGYLFVPDFDGHELHAWVEVYIPGAGWRGYDPILGLGVDETYIALCASTEPSNTMPVTGVFRGKGISKIDFKIKIQACK